MSNPILEIKDLRVYYHVEAGAVKAVDGVSLNVKRGEILGLVGESGAGKSMIGKAILGTLPRAIQVVSGRISLDGTDLQTLSARERRRSIGAQVALIPQDPLTALTADRLARLVVAFIGDAYRKKGLVYCLSAVLIAPGCLS